MNGRVAAMLIEVKNIYKRLERMLGKEVKISIKHSAVKGKID